MSVGTIVTIVLLMSVLVLGIFLVQKIFGSGTNAIDQIDSQVQNEINKLFSDEAISFVIYPTSRSISIKKGNDPAGFAFSVRNTFTQERTFTYQVLSSDVTDCQGAITNGDADDYLLGGEGEFSLGPGNTLELPRLVKFKLPESAPPCTVTYVVTVNYLDSNTNTRKFYKDGDLYVTFK